MVADITEAKLAAEALRASEERYSLAMEAAEEGHFDWNLRTEEIFVSTHMQKVLNLPPDLVFRTRGDLRAKIPYHPDDRPWLDRLRQAVLAGPALQHEFEYRLLHGADVNWVRARWKIFRDAAGAALRVVGVVADITERKHAEEELKAMERKLRQAQRLEAMGTLAGGIAHDFNNILGAILGFGEMAMRDAAKGSRLRRDLDSIMEAGERGRALVERILAFSRSGVSERVAVHVEKVVRESVDLLTANLPPCNTIKTQLRAGRAAMRGDATQIHQVFMNLAINGVQAMASGGMLRVSLNVENLASPRIVTTGTVAAGDYIVLKVSDDGTGIPVEILEHIFDPFFTTKEVGAGTGLGLSLVHGIVSEMGGAIDVATTPGSGSTFSVYLPRSGEATDELLEEPPDMPRGERQRVLVVDDEEPLVRLATRTLEDLGYAPEGFTSSVAAVEAFRSDPKAYDAVITDERMPELSGSALIREVRGIRRDIPILLVSGYLGGSVVDRAYNSGADEVLQKPLSARSLAVSLARALQPK
jgi:PAS domain S-box-containing protein